MTHANTTFNKAQHFLKNDIIAFIVAICLVAMAATPLSAQSAEKNSPAVKKPQAVQAVAKVNINKADAKTLADTLNGVGLKKAEAIVGWRNKFGKFVRIEQLMEVKGIGEKTLERNRAAIAL